MKSNSPSTIHHPKFAFTLVELLVVITIIGILIALLLPAVQAAREAARKLQCTNHLKQIGLAVLQHEEAQGFFPTGGWNDWAGEPNRGFDRRQPGGWLYNILPYLEMQSLHDLGINDGLDGSADRPGFIQRSSTPVATFICPSRRQAIVYPGATWNQPRNVPNPSYSLLGRSDYAGSGGDTHEYHTGVLYGPGSLAIADAMSANDWANSYGTYSTGIFYQRSLVRMAEVADGTSNTYLAGEKYICPDAYLNGESWSDNFSWDSGWVNDIVRWCGKYGGHAPDEWVPRHLTPGDYNEEMVPMQDTPGLHMCWTFGSAHAGGFNMVFCDGSVHSINYSIDLETHYRLGSIADGLVIDGKAF